MPPAVQPVTMTTGPLGAMVIAAATGADSDGCAHKRQQYACAVVRSIIRVSNTSAFPCCFSGVQVYTAYHDHTA